MQRCKATPFVRAHLEDLLMSAHAMAAILGEDHRLGSSIWNSLLVVVVREGNK